MATGALDGRVALVTGAGRLRGIGRATALALAQLGADVVVTGTGRDPGTYPEDEKKAGWRDVESTAEQIRALGRKALTWTGDVSTGCRSPTLTKPSGEKFSTSSSPAHSCSASVSSRS